MSLLPGKSACELLVNYAKEKQLFLTPHCHFSVVKMIAQMFITHFEQTIEAVVIE